MYVCIYIVCVCLCMCMCVCIQVDGTTASTNMRMPEFFDIV